MPEQSSPPPAALGAWMAAIADCGWHQAKVEDASRLSGLPGQSIADFGDRHDAAAALADRALHAAFVQASGQGSVRERLFDGLMAGLDVLQEHRAAVLAMWQARDPGLMLLLSRRVPTGVRRLASAAGVDSSGWNGALRMIGLSAIGAELFRDWMADMSPDMAGSMASLDKLLYRAEEFETDGFSPKLLGLPGFANPFRRAPESGHDLQPE